MPDLLNLTMPSDAWAVFKNNLPASKIEIEEVAVRQSLNRITARAIIATELLPAFIRSTMDGYAVLASDTCGASEKFPVILQLAGEVAMGSEPAFVISTGKTALIHTGGMLPIGANAVVMIEDAQLRGSAKVEIWCEVSLGENVINAGEDAIPGQVVIPAGLRIRPVEIGCLMAMGQMNVSVTKRPKVGILSTGNEVVSPDVKPQIGQVRDINSYTLRALVEQAGGQAVTYGIIPDQFDCLKETLHAALAECQAVIITAGSSVSARDITAAVIQSEGMPGILVHGINIRPGKPTILAVCDGKGVIGLPGNPISALVIAGLFVVPFINILTGMQRSLPASIQARLAVDLPSQAGREEWIPVSLTLTGNEYSAQPLFFKSNLIFNLEKADGLVKIPVEITGMGAGDMVRVDLLQ